MRRECASDRRVVQAGAVDDVPDAAQQPDQRPQDRVATIDHPDEPTDSRGRLRKHQRRDGGGVVDQDDTRQGR